MAHQHHQQHQQHSHRHSKVKAVEVDDEEFEPLQYDVTTCLTMLFRGRTTLYLDEDTVSIQDNCLCNNSSTEVRSTQKTKIRKRKRKDVWCPWH